MNIISQQAYLIIGRLKQLSANFTAMVSRLFSEFSNYLTILAAMSVLSVLLSPVSRVYLFAYVRYGYLMFMLFRIPLRRTLTSGRNDYMNEPFGVLRFFYNFLTHVFEDPLYLILASVVGTYVMLNPLSMLVGYYLPWLNGVSLGLVNSILELTLFAGFVELAIKYRPSVSVDTSTFASGLAGSLLMLWLVHDELICFMPLLTPVLSLFALPAVEMIIVGTCCYAMAYFVADLMPKLTGSEWQIRLLTQDTKILHAPRLGKSQRDLNNDDYTLDADARVTQFLRALNGNPAAQRDFAALINQYVPADACASVSA